MNTYDRMLQMEAEEWFEGYDHNTTIGTLRDMTGEPIEDEDSEIVIIYLGEEGDKELAQAVAEKLEEQFEDVEVEIHQGDQPVYPYLFSVE